MTKADAAGGDPEAAEISLRVTGTSQTTQIIIEEGVLERIGSILRPLVVGRHVLLVTDETVKGLYGATVTDSITASGLRVDTYTIPPGERSKSLSVAQGLYAALAANRVGRDGIVMALGGGVVSDLAGFAAATWMRGIDFTVCPTTVEADVDASIGGKTAVNVPAGKNLVGAFHQPRLVAIDPLCLRTLSQRDVQAGLAESIKHALIADESFVAWHEANADAVLTLDPATTTEMIRRNVAIKARIVSSDPTERGGARTLLNFGHTIGHAVEAVTGYSLRHGECVSIGMVAACRLSNRLGLLGLSVVEQVERLLERFHLPVTVAHHPGITRIPSAGEILAKIAQDKKGLDDSVRFVLLEGIGRPAVRSQIPEPLIHEVCTSILAKSR